VVFLTIHSWLVHESGDLRVLGGLFLTEEAAAYAASVTGSARVETINAFDGWRYPERVWTGPSLAAARVMLALSIALVAAGIVALARRLPSFLRWFSKLTGRG
jgi:hypothetical protein